MRITSLFLVALIVGLALPGVGTAGSNVTSIPLEDFLAAQGTYASFFGDVPDYVGWVDGDFTTFALVDYAGLAAGYIDEEGGDTDTTVEGTVKERDNGDGTVTITAKLRAKKALAFAQSVEDIVANDFDFAITPTIFGQKVADVLDGEDPALGWAHFDISFTLPDDYTDLPDIVDIVFGGDTYAPASFMFKSVTFETIDGVKSRLTVHQKASVDVGDDDFTYTKEVVEVEQLGS